MQVYNHKLVLDSIVDRKLTINCCKLAVACTGWVQACYRSSAGLLFAWSTFVQYSMLKHNIVTSLPKACNKLAHACFQPVAILHFLAVLQVFSEGVTSTPNSTHYFGVLSLSALKCCNDCKVLSFFKLIVLYIFLQAHHTGSPHPLKACTGLLNRGTNSSWSSYGECNGSKPMPVLEWWSVWGRSWYIKAVKSL